ncbi:MAG: TetR/AcrR family transcriptional regulator [Rhizobiaceae bacterium]
MAAAKYEFAEYGLSGARVDAIASRAKANKRMIYHYFVSKDHLFQAVLEEAYLEIRTAEQALDLDQFSPEEAMEKLVRFTWTYYLDNPEFISLINSANLHRARHLAGSERIRIASRQLVETMQKIVDRGVQTGSFRSGVDVVQLSITIAAIGYYYLTNRYTGSIIYERDFMDPDVLDTRIDFNIDTVMRHLAA